MENIRLNLRQRKGRGFCNLGYTVSVFLDEKFTHGGKERSKSILHKQLYYTGDSETQSEAFKNINKIIANYLEMKYSVPTIDFTTLGTIDLNIKYQDELIKYINEFIEDNPFSFTMTNVKPIIVKFEEKHGDGYFIAHSEKDAMRVFKQVLKSRFADGWYTWMKDYVPYEMKEENRPKFTSDEINSLPESMENEKHEMMKSLFKWSNLEKQQNDTREQYNNICLVVNSDILNSDAFLILNDLRKGEYEDFVIIQPETIKG